MAKLIDNKAIGIEVSWSFGDGDAKAVTLDRQIVKSLFDDSGFMKGLIDDIAPSDALVRSARMAPRVRKISVKEFRRPNKDTPRSFGVYYVGTKEGESGDDFKLGARVRVEGKSIVLKPPENSVCIPDCEVVAKDMTLNANTMIRYVFNLDISNALLYIGHHQLYWISRRRNQGGVYYLNNDESAERFVKLLHDLRDLTSTYSRDKQFIPQIVEMYPRPLTMETWEGAAKDDFQSKIDKLLEDLKKMKAEQKMRDSTIEKRADECDLIIAQAMKYKSFLKENFDSIAHELRTIKDDFINSLSENRDKATTLFSEIEKTEPVRDVGKNRTFPEKKKGRRRVIKNVDELFKF